MQMYLLNPGKFIVTSKTHINISFLSHHIQDPTHAA